VTRAAHPDIARVTESPVRGSELALHTHAGWADELPWLLQGITGRGVDMSLFGRTEAGVVMGRWLRLRDELGCRAVVHARQVHEADVLVHHTIMDGVLVAGEGDGHATARAGALLTISVADCVPIYVAAPDVQAVALLHGGWRGIAAGILERGIAVLHHRFGAAPSGLRVHLGPAICGACYEVGSEVPAALGLPDTGEGGRVRLDLREVLVRRARACGVAAAHVSTSTFCTRCGDPPFYSHRGGYRERQLAVLAIRSDGR
jgi:polyphenol oxidase